jgi:hypothetical protein
LALVSTSWCCPLCMPAGTVTENETAPLLLAVRVCRRVVEVSNVAVTVPPGVKPMAVPETVAPSAAVTPLALPVLPSAEVTEG